MQSYKIEYKGTNNSQWALHSECHGQYEALRAFNQLNIIVLDDNINTLQVRVLDKKNQVLISKKIQSFEIYPLS